MKNSYNIRDMPFSVKDLTKEDCQTWEQNKVTNPEKPKNPKTNYRVIKDNKTYKDIESRCKKLLSDDSKSSPKISPQKPLKPKKEGKKFTKELCEQWEINKKKRPDKPKNPFTNYRISANCGIYNDLNKNCEKLLNNHEQPASKSPPKSPPKSPSKSPPKSPSKSPPKSSPKSSPKSPPKSPPKSSPPKESLSQQATIDLYYPDIDDMHFREKLTNLAEFYIYNVPPYPQIKNKQDFEKVSQDLCGAFEKTAYQYFASSYISNRTPYKSILLYHGVGVGKTCSAITLAEGFLTSHNMYSEPKVWVIMPLALKNSFKEQIFSLSSLEDFEKLANQCTGDLYIKLGQILRESNKDKLQTKIKKLIKTRYRLFTYDAFATFIEDEYINKGKAVKDKVIIVDEAHNIRTSGNSQNSSDNVEKRVYTSLVNVLETGVNNRLVLLSATPMYNKPEDIFDLLYLLCLNDKHTDLVQPFPALFNDKNEVNQQALSIIEKLSKYYISYLKGKNPFTFAIKLPATYLNRSNRSSRITLLDKQYSKDSNNKQIAPAFDGWLSYIDDGIVTSGLGEKQLEYIQNNGGADDNNVFNNLQPMNIVYDDAIGERGFNTIFTRNDDKNAGGLNVRYNKKYTNALYPDTEHLAQYSGKFLNICNLIKNTTGIIVIYSGYIWSGIIPIAIALEHMGFDREGTHNILDNPDVIPDAPRYGMRGSPKYCILSSENSEIMGGTSIDSMMKIINNQKNIDGSQIKVILITPVAGEGLSFYNVREMHIVEPWFHFNRVTQIIGRGIRNCRHQQLPLEERNVTVFMHASVYADGDRDQETTDIHAFRIASKKLIQSNIIDKVIRDNAVDCSLMRNINYFPKSLFELGKVKIRTSQGVEIDYQYGDTELDEPQCKIVVKDISDAHLRKETFQNLIFAMQNRLRKMVLEFVHNGEMYISFDDIFRHLQIHKDIINETIAESVYPNVLIDGYILVPHDDGIHIIDMSVDKHVNNKLRITYVKKKEHKQDALQNDKKSLKCNMDKLAKIVHAGDAAIIALYKYLTSDCFMELVKKFIEEPVLSDTDEAVAELLYREGALIRKKEIRSLRGASVPDKYIGYVNIFNNKFEPVVFIDSRYRDLIDREVDELISIRRRIQKPQNMANERVSWGMIVPVLDKKSGIYSNVFKILTAGSSVGVKSGMVCTSLSKTAQEKIFEEFNINNASGTKAENCHKIAMKMYETNRISINPEYKPN